MNISDQHVCIDDGDTFIWRHDSSGNGKKYSWSDERNMTVPDRLVPKLNRAFITQVAAGIVAELGDADRETFAKILVNMGASNEDLINCGLTGAAYRNDPDAALTYAAEETIPPATHTPFNSSLLRNWFFADDDRPLPAISSPIALLGNGPFEIDEFQSFLESKRIDCCECSDADGVVVIGRSGWTQEEIDDLIDNHEGSDLRVYSQEMLLAYLASGRDPLREPSALRDFYLTQFRAGHEGLKAVSQGWAGWIDCFVRPNRQRRNGSSAQIDRVDTSPLKELGYRCGRSGLPDNKRREILTFAFREELPRVGDAEYMQKWGEPGTPKRLQRLAEHLANLTVSCRLRQNAEAYEDAIEDYESDLAWLKATFYRGGMQFGWPDTRVGG